MVFRGRQSVRRRRRPHGPRASWRQWGPAFTVLWSANLLTSSAGWSTGLVVSIHVYSLTGSATAAGVLLVATTAPAVLLGGVTGALADRYDRRATLAAASAARVPVLVGLALAAGSTSAEGWWPVLVLVLVDAVARQVGVPAEQGLVADLAGPHLPAAAAANSTATNLARLTAPAAAGFLYAATGPSTTLWTLTVCQGIAALLLAGLALWRRDRCGVPEPTRSPPRWTPGVGIPLVWRNRHLRAVTVLYVLDGVKEGALSSLFTPFMLSVVRVGPDWIGVTNGAFAVGALLAAPWVPVAVRRCGRRRTVAVGASCSALALLPLLLAPSGPTAVVAFVLAGAPFTLSWVVAGTTVLEHAPAARRSTAVGTTGGVWAGAMLFSALVAGPTADVVGPTAVLLVVTLAHVAAGPAYLLLGPRDAPHTGGRR